MLAEAAVIWTGPVHSVLSSIDETPTVCQTGCVLGLSMLWVFKAIVVKLGAEESKLTTTQTGVCSLE